MNVQEAIDALPTSVEGLVEYLTLNGYTGVPEDAHRCPLANYFKMTTGNGHVYVDEHYVIDESPWYKALEHWNNEDPFPDIDPEKYVSTEAMNEFIVAFDRGEYPTLEIS